MKRKIVFNNVGSQPQLAGPVITWYHQLQNTKVTELEFHRNYSFGPRSSSKLIVSLVDGSKYILQRRVKHANRALVPEFSDIIQSVSSPNITTLPLIHIKFVDKSSQCLDQSPDLLFVLSICYGAQHHNQDQIARLLIDDDFFALAVILNVARARPSVVVPKPSQSIQSTTPLEYLWKEAYHSIQNQEHTFWGHTIADETKNITRELVYRAARSSIATRLPQGTDEAKLLAAASIIAHVESIVKKRELNESNIWDDAWNKRWDAVWQDFNPDVGDWQFPLQGILGTTHKPTVEGRAPGGIAGRTPERYVLDMDDGAAWLRSILIGHHPTLVKDFKSEPSPKQVQEKQESDDDREGHHAHFGTFFETMYAGLRGRLTGESDPAGEPKPMLVTPTKALPKLDNQGACSCPPRDGPIPNQDHNHEIWASPREMAVHLAWEKAWLVSVEMGRKFARSVQTNDRIEGTNGDTPEQLTVIKRAISRTIKATIDVLKPLNHPSSQHTNAPQFGSHTPTAQTGPPTTPYRRRSSAGAQALRQLLLGSRAQGRDEYQKELQDLVKERTYREKKEIARLKAKASLSSDADPLSEIKTKNNPPEAELKKRAQETWNKTIASSGGLNAKLDSLAEQLWQTITEQSSGHTFFENATKTAWKERFKATWELAWKEAWVHAWQAVWDNAWDAAVARGAEFGVEEVLEKDSTMSRAHYESLKSTQAYLKIQKLIDQGNHLDCLEQVRSMMKELYRIYESLQHSIPVSREGSIKITGFENNKVPKRRKFRSGRRVEERKSTHLTYYELQEWVEKHYIAPKFSENEDGQKLFKRRIAQVWNTALNVYNASSKKSATLAGTMVIDTKPQAATHPTG